MRWNRRPDNKDKEVIDMMFGGGMILVWLLFIAGGYFLIKALLDNNQRQSGQPEDPLTILERRYANGEIDREEYLKRKKDLSGS